MVKKLTSRQIRKIANATDVPSYVLAEKYGISIDRVRSYRRHVKKAKTYRKKCNRVSLSANQIIEIYDTPHYRGSRAILAKLYGVPVSRIDCIRSKQTWSGLINSQ